MIQIEVWLSKWNKTIVKSHITKLIWKKFSKRVFILHWTLLVGHRKVKIFKDNYVCIKKQEWKKIVKGSFSSFIGPHRWIKENNACKSTKKPLLIIKFLTFSLFLYFNPSHNIFCILDLEFFFLTNIIVFLRLGRLTFHLSYFSSIFANNPWTFGIWHFSTDFTTKPSRFFIFFYLSFSQFYCK